MFQFFEIRDRFKLLLFNTWRQLFRSEKMRRESLRASWGREFEQPKNMDLIAMVFHKKPCHSSCVDEATWQDLDMDGLFSKIDRCLTMLGRQNLYGQLRSFESDDAILRERNRQHAFFRENAKIREDIQLILSRLNAPMTAWLTPFIMHPPAKPRYAGLIHVFGSLPLVFGLLCLYSGVFFAPFVLMLFCNAVLNEIIGRELSNTFSGFCQLSNAMSVAQRLGNLPDHGLAQLKSLNHHLLLIQKIGDKCKWLSVDRRQGGDLAICFYFGINALFLADLRVFSSVSGQLQIHRAELLEILDSIGNLDANISVASYQKSLPVFCVPKMNPDRCIHTKGLYHPMIPKPIANDFSLDEHSALITGSNMAGKTTFIRTVGINIILARTLNFCLAEAAQLPKVLVKTSIKLEDSLSTGKSYYMAEIERVLTFIRDAEDDQPCLFILDEIFRGTNTVERVAAAAAVLRHLSQRHLALVSTHDLELFDRLKDRFDLFHFSEQVIEGQCTFDYQIQSGPCRTRNAIRLLETCGYPDTIIEEAREFANENAEAMASL